MMYKYSAPSFYKNGNFILVNFLLWLILLELMLYKKFLLFSSYAENIKKHSAIARDFTSQSMDKAIFWVEHAARHGGASHLRPATAEANLFQFLCLDIISVVLGLISIFLFTMYVLYRYLASIVFVRVSLKTKEH